MSSGKEIKKRAISPRHKLFADEYLKGCSAREAAKRAGYKVSKYLDRVASNILLREDVQVYIQNCYEQRRQKADISAERLLKELASIAFSNPKHTLDENGFPLPLHKIPDEVAAALQVAKAHEYTNKRGNRGIRWSYKFARKDAALKALGDYFGINIRAETERAISIEEALKFVHDRKKPMKVKTIEIKAKEIAKKDDKKALPPGFAAA